MRFVHMWRAIALTFVLFVTSACAHPTDDDAVLAVVAEKLCTDEGLKYAILSSDADNPSWLYHPEDEPPNSHLHQLEALTARNPKGTLLPIYVDYGCLQMIDERAINALFADRIEDGWAKFRATYAPATVLVTLSLPAYSTDQAWLTVATHCGGLCANGELWVLKRDGKTWRLVSRDGLWVS